MFTTKVAQDLNLLCFEEIWKLQITLPGVWEEIVVFQWQEKLFCIYISPAGYTGTFSFSVLFPLYIQYASDRYCSLTKCSFAFLSLTHLIKYVSFHPKTGWPLNSHYCQPNFLPSWAPFKIHDITITRTN